MNNLESEVQSSVGTLDDLDLKESANVTTNKVESILDKLAVTDG